MKSFRYSNTSTLAMSLVATMFAACLMGAAGCGGPDNKLGRLAVSGKITLDGQLLDHGRIDIFPRGGRGVSAGGRISPDGSYAIAEAKGLPPGEYVVSIFSSIGGDYILEPGQRAEDIEMGERMNWPKTPVIRRIPPEFNLESKQFVEVTADGPNVFDFDIPAIEQ